MVIVFFKIEPHVGVRTRVSFQKFPISATHLSTIWKEASKYLFIWLECVRGSLFSILQLFFIKWICLNDLFTQNSSKKCPKWVTIRYVYKQNKEKNPRGKVVKSRKLQLRSQNILKNTRFLGGDVWMYYSRWSCSKHGVLFTIILVMVWFH